MLRALHINDFVIVDHTEVEFGPGFTVFSGETGAGKSILIDALALALGERADASVLREGATRAEISAVFDVPDTLTGWLADHELDSDSLVLRRLIDSQGRSRSFINGMPATLTQLRELGEQLVDIHGQHAHQSLLKADSQRDLLDGHGDHSALRRGIADAWKAWRDVARRLETVERDAESLQQERERLQWQADELDRLALGADEWEELQAEHTRLAHAQSLIDGASQTIAALEEDDDAAHTRLAAASQRIAQLANHDSALTPVSEALESARIALQEAVSDLNSYLARLEVDPQRLSIVEARLQAVFETARKFRLTPDELPERHQTLLAQLDTLKESEDVQALRARAEAARAAYDALAKELSTARHKAAASLSRQVTQAMQTLAMSGGKFEAVVQPGEPGVAGADLVEFRVAGHAGTTPRALAKVASGGELARISLALSVIASRAARVPTLIFDEVDTGVGGAVAEVVGRLLRELGNFHQVLCVTHLPQVAACGNVHYEVEKRQSGSSTVSGVHLLNRTGRIDEIARMLGGIEITATTRKHAREMLGNN
ncbi:DNA repair protein RecN [Pigmentiphaga litoralis]|uniref:DNA repair protein RecN n=1 Tax=Pigmentiphaga litoralis TaxID=516702 RepID=A0A7Y9LQF8_9BURK|nr:DNA repair protein RecN [Pigmentiphaga litoralis]NYE26909.1 DNA repair protein RecN (Recombination protein N) [Pigmentiphaga litoralis]NYE85681.1 DNA repair protein RecN (Recombination protein N) [Pigmentiphaga litoralis]